MEPLQKRVRNSGQLQVGRLVGHDVVEVKPPHVGESLRANAVIGKDIRAQLFVRREWRNKAGNRVRKVLLSPDVGSGPKQAFDKPMIHLVPLQFADVDCSYGDVIKERTLIFQSKPTTGLLLAHRSSNDQIEERDAQRRRKVDVKLENARKGRRKGPAVHNWGPGRC